MRTGRFIVFEGIDGAGKTTQLALLEQYLRDSGRRVARTAEPTDGEIGRMLRVALAGGAEWSACEMAALFALDRIRHNIAPKTGIDALLRDGVDVLCDRYYYSSLAYQGSEIGGDWVEELNLHCPQIRKPDLCVFLDLTPQESLARIRARGEATEIYETPEKLEQVRARFLRVLERLKERDRIVRVSSAGGIEETQAAIRQAVDALEISE